MPVAEKFSNMAYITVTETAANTLTFSKLETGIAPFEKRGWILARLEYFISVSSGDFAADADACRYGLSASNSISDVGIGENAVIDYNLLKRVDFGAAATGLLIEKPQVKDLSTIPGGGILIAPNPIYIFAYGSNAPNAFTVSCRIYYVSVDLKADEFWELVEMRRMVGT